MKPRLKNYLQSLTPAKKKIAEETLNTFFACECDDVVKIINAETIYNYCRDLVIEEIEHAVVLLLNKKNKIIKRIEIGRGGLTETAFDVRLALKECLLNNATVMAIVHNHPSGDPKSSKDDDNITKGFRDACKTMRIHFLDHVIIGDGDYYSYMERGRL